MIIRRYRITLIYFARLFHNEKRDYGKKHLSRKRE